ncbi:MAG: CopG family transcriptional regulator [Clostridia bacterium]|nr:CopG family transcriptional regulator [Clostridia bacterium]
MQVQLTKEQVQALRAISDEEGVSIAELIRRGAHMVIASRGAVSREERVRRALAIVGQFTSSETDLSVNHDKYLEDDFR